MTDALDPFEVWYNSLRKVNPDWWESALALGIQFPTTSTDEAKSFLQTYYPEVFL